MGMIGSDQKTSKGRNFTAVRKRRGESYHNFGNIAKPHLNWEQRYADPQDLFSTQSPHEALST
jgi:hypothetical protein